MPERACSAGHVRSGAPRSRRRRVEAAGVPVAGVLRVRLILVGVQPGVAQLLVGLGVGLHDSPRTRSCARPSRRACALGRPRDRVAPRRVTGRSRESSYSRYRSSARPSTSAREPHSSRSSLARPRGGPLQCRLLRVGCRRSMCSTSRRRRVAGESRQDRGGEFEARAHASHRRQGVRRVARRFADSHDRHVGGSDGRIRQHARGRAPGRARDAAAGELGGWPRLADILHGHATDR